jgi:hypothetical protein
MTGRSFRAQGRLLLTFVAATAVACGRMYHPHFLTFDET